MERVSYLSQVIACIREKLKSSDTIKRREVIKMAMKAYKTDEMSQGLVSTADGAIKALKKLGVIYRIDKGVYKKGGE